MRYPRSRPRTVALVATALLSVTGVACLFWAPRDGLGSATIPSGIAATPLVLDPAQPDRRRFGGVVYRGGVALASGDRHFGGFSGARVDADGTGLVIMTDRGKWLSLTLTLDLDAPAGVPVVAVDAMRMAVQRDTEGRGIAPDSESLTRLSDGRWATGEEQDHKIRLHPPEMVGKTSVLAPPEKLRSAPPNRGLEALATLPDDRLVAITEGLSDGQGQTLGWVVTPAGKWDEVRLVQTGSYRPTDLDILPDGDLLLLERRYNWLEGVGARLSRIRRTALDRALADGTVIVPEEIAVLGPDLAIDNMEAVAVVPGSRPARFYLLSDDNFFVFQRTLLLVFELVE